jgi:hypothetical protein
MNSQRTILFAMLLGFLSLLGPAARTAVAVPASSPSSVSVAAVPVFAESVSWYGFRHYWMGFVKNSDRVVVIVAIVAAAAVFIITRGKWLK